MTMHILAAVGTTEDMPVLAAAILKARQTGARLTAVHIADLVPWWATLGACYGCVDGLQIASELAHAMKLHCAEVLQREAPDVQTTAISVALEGRSVGRRIAMVAEELDVDLIVLGTGHVSRWRCWEERISDMVSRCTRRPVMVATTNLEAVRPALYMAA